MSIAGLCQICERETASHTCPRCGTAVCDDHWDGEHRLCTDCAAASTA